MATILAIFLSTYVFERLPGGNASISPERLPEISNVVDGSSLDPKDILLFDLDNCWDDNSNLDRWAKEHYQAAVQSGNLSSSRLRLSCFSVSKKSKFSKNYMAARRQSTVNSRKKLLRHLKSGYDNFREGNLVQAKAELAKAHKALESAQDDIEFLSKFGIENIDMTLDRSWDSDYKRVYFSCATAKNRIRQMITSSRTTDDPSQP